MRNALRFVLPLFAIAIWWASPCALADEEPVHAEGEEHGHADGGEHEAGDGDHGHSHADGEGHGHAGDGDHAADHAHHAGPASNHPLSIDPDLAIATLLIFVVLLIVLRKFAWGPILVGLAKRENGVAGDIDAAAARREDAEKMLAEYQSQLERAGAEVRAMLDGAKKEADAMKHSILEEAAKAAAAEKDRATSEILAAKDAAISEIGTESVKIAFKVASGALRRDVNPENHKELIADAGL